jgi:hypothetical protein
MQLLGIDTTFGTVTTNAQRSNLRYRAYLVSNDEAKRKVTDVNFCVRKRC